jgi:DNA-directed RNA polymerase specialized sigma24 family protein
MADDTSVTHWINGMKAGNSMDIQRLWDRYFRPLVRLAEAKLPGHARRELDGEDVALSAFDSFCGRVSRGQFPQLADRNDFWRLLATITVSKVIDTVRHQTRQKRGGGFVVGESAIMDGDPVAAGMDRLPSREATPEFTVESAEAYERLFDKLGDPMLRTIALLRLDGHSSKEIATAIGTSSRTVDRKIRLIRVIWRDELRGRRSPPSYVARKPRGPEQGNASNRFPSIETPGQATGVPGLPSDDGPPDRRHIRENLDESGRAIAQGGRQARPAIWRR